MLKTEGFAQLIQNVADKAQLATVVADAVRIAATLDGRVPESAGLQALTDADRTFLELAGHLPATQETDVGDLILLTRTGRVAIVLAKESDPPPGAHVLATVGWDGDRPEAVTARWRREHDALRQEIRNVHRGLQNESASAVARRLDRIAFSLMHMAPVLLYVDDHVYSNLGKFGNLPGKSLSPDDKRCLLTRLKATAVAEWDPVDACFVACLYALLLSGPPVRAEEFNGSQLTPAALRAFLVERLAEYGATDSEESDELPLAGLENLALRCAQMRDVAVANGQLPFREINGLTLHKRERLMPAPNTLADVPHQVVGYLMGRLDRALPSDQVLSGSASEYAELMAQLARAAAPPGFTSAFEGFLHGFLRCAAEAFEADVSMSRGPRSFAPLRADPAPQQDPLTLGTGDFYCCVAPRDEFTRRFAAKQDGLVRTLSAYSARMRYNTWHYLPHTLGISDRQPGRDDWFFAPTLPDVTDWSDQHHTGHVAFGVRHAIRVPFGISYDGRQLPGLYDLRLMRTCPPPFTVAELRAATATGRLLAELYQAMSVHEPVVTDFDRNWYQQFHG